MWQNMFISYCRVDAPFLRNSWRPLTGTTLLDLFAETLGWNRFVPVCVELRFVALSQSRLAPRPVKVINVVRRISLPMTANSASHWSSLFITSDRFIRGTDVPMRAMPYASKSSGLPRHPQNHHERYRGSLLLAFREIAVRLAKLTSLLSDPDSRNPPVLIGSWVTSMVEQGATTIRNFRDSSFCTILR